MKLQKQTITVKPESLIVRPSPDPPKPVKLTRQQQYQTLHRIHWENIKALDWPSGPLVYGSKHRCHTRQEMREMARLAARRQLRAIREKERQEHGTENKS